MRCYLIEDIYEDNAKKISKALDEQGWRGPLEGIWYLPVPGELLTKEQREHLSECGPYMMALEMVDRVEEHDFKLELLVRARNKIRCSCVAYATPAQREWMIGLLDDFFREQDVPV
ncbi:MAG: hypothetical protein AB7E32_08675 [Desulfovibrio sp.]